ncbi:peptide ABC transporter substrate-binding protein [Virgibacillus siamensis]|uniref:peptide ABC transporter substrate-binding protein n=1 Tax=Virgibacillus siamensis TaxID=480071 RepID=UPI00098562B4|nr:peptide ABC transporter substrate-binding protein [Virgibacillus siamensis]
MSKGKFKWSFVAALLLALGMVLAACSGGDSGESGSDSSSGGDDGEKSSASKELAGEQVLHFVRGSDLPSVDISVATDTTSAEVIQRTHPGLITFKNKEMVPEMAKDMPEVSKDGLTYTFKLRENLKWSNGDPLTASDFVYAWQRLIDPDTKSEYAYIMGVANVKNADKIMNEDSDIYGKVEKLGVKAVDKHTLQVQLESPIPFFTSLLSFNKFGPLNEDFVKKQGDKFAKEPENLLTVGPYKLTKWDHGVGWTLEKYKDYYAADEVNITKATFKVVKEKNTQLSLYKSDEIQMDGLSAEQVNAWKDKPDFQQVPKNCVFYWTLNANNVPEFKNEKLRKAMSMVIDRKGLTNVLLNNGSIPAQYIVPKGLATGPDGKDFREGVEDYLPGGVEEAKGLWKEAKKELGIDTLEVEYATTDGDTSAQMGEYMANQLEQLKGLKVTIKKLPWNAYLEYTQNDKQEIGAGSGWCPDYKDPMTFLGYWYSGNPNTDGVGLERPKYDKLVEKARELAKQQKPEERWAALKEAEKLLIEKAYTIPTYQAGAAIVIKPYVEGIVPQSFGIEYYFREAKVYKH